MCIRDRTIATRKDSIKKKQDVFRGRISLASYSNYSESTQKPAYRFNYTFSLSGNHVNNSKLSFDSYISFRHRTNEWYKVQENINNALKIYTLALQYSFNKSMDLFAGRRVNYRIASMGAIDGIQFEKRFNHIILGSVLGSRPDLYDYSLNLKLLEYGAYAAHQITGKNGLNIENTVALINQMSSGNTDRRFIHVQHVSTLFKNLSIFGSTEMDIYKKLIYWELEMQKSDSPEMQEILQNQKSEANTEFFKFVSKNYASWVSPKSKDGPVMSHTMFQFKVLPHAEKGTPLFFVLIDNLRFDQWKAIQPIFAESFRILEEESFYSILPTATQYARNAIFAGLMPGEIEKQFPVQWKNDEEEGGKNLHEEEFFLSLIHI